MTVDLMAEQRATAKEVWWVVKRGDEYADGSRRWTKDVLGAFKFPDRQWAKDHAGTFDDARVVMRWKLVK